MILPTAFENLPDVLVKRLAENLSKKEVACLRIQRRYYTLFTSDVSL